MNGERDGLMVQLRLFHAVELRQETSSEQCRIAPDGHDSITLKGHHKLQVSNNSIPDMWLSSYYGTSLQQSITSAICKIALQLLIKLH
ncbi:hypothetical protein GUJ93_ZPchr0002g26522 [Zizania palustris]|uniref:Uncharacterized protein n=1 Tax=Zizania palustris TaxID=103762 RepID=A0A8J5VTK5_ZIZPA|nr:hypothetical protein GUJ93_ZPchr0002g26522 [Zizania palustris]